MLPNTKLIMPNWVRSRTACHVPVGVYDRNHSLSFVFSLVDLDYTARIVFSPAGSLGSLEHFSRRWNDLKVNPALLCELDCYTHILYEYLHRTPRSEVPVKQSRARLGQHRSLHRARR